MLFDLNGNTYQVKFARDNRLPKPTTTAELFIKDGNEFKSLNIKGHAFCNPKDKFEKSKGRKIALASLLRTHLFKHGETLFSATKEDKTKIWEIYFKEHKK
jgi:hypothetical protein